MTSLRQEVISMVESLPEDKIVQLFDFLRGIEDLSEKNKRLAKKAAAFEKLESLRRSIPDLDYDKELASYRDERFSNANFA